VIEKIDLTAYRGQADDPIRVIASDPIGVLAVNVVIRDAKSRDIVEQGPAALDESQNWTYVVSAALGDPVVIEATATDRTENATTASVAYPTS